MRFLKENEDQLRTQSIPSKLQRGECNDFWKEIKALSPKKESLPITVLGILCCKPMGRSFQCNCKFCWLHSVGSLLNKSQDRK